MKSISWTQLLAELELLSHGSTVSWSPTGRSRSSEHGFPAGESKPPHEYWRDRYDRAEEHKRPAIVRQALADLESWRKRTAPLVVVEESEADVDKRIMRLIKQRWTIPEVAQSERCTETRVRRAMLTVAKSDEEQKAADADLDEDTTARVLELAGKDLSQRQIAMIAKVSPRTVGRILDKQRKAA